MIIDRPAKARAIQVRDMHLGGRRCPQCTPDGPCLLEAVWLDVIIQIGAGRHLARSRS